MTRPWLRPLFRAIGALCLVCGAVGALVFLMTMIDPAGAQAANDAVPFGTTPSRLESAFGFMLSLCVAAIGARMTTRRNTAP